MIATQLRARGIRDPTRAVVEHVSFVLSHAFDRIDARAFPFGRILRIVDMSRLDVTDTGYEAYVFLKAMAHVSSVAFPERVHKVVIVNPPAGADTAATEICGWVADTLGAPGARAEVWRA